MPEAISGSSGTATAPNTGAKPNKNEKGNKSDELQGKVNDALKKQSQLDKDAFMRLFLEQLKHQDPTAPMETEKILEQTAMLTQLEQQEDMKKTLSGMTDAIKTMSSTSEKLAKLQETLGGALKKIDTSIKSSAEATNLLTQLSGYNSVAMIGKVAETNLTGINIKNNDKVRFDLYFDEKIDTSKGTPTLKIYNSKGEVIKESPLAPHNGKKGYVSFEWDTKDKNGAHVSPGSYHIVAEYNLNPSTNSYRQTQIGRGEVQSIIYQNGVPYIKLGDYLTAPLGNVLQFHDKG